MRTETQRRKAQRFNDWLKAHEQRPGPRTARRLRDEEEWQPSAPLSRWERANAQRISYGNDDGLMYKRIVCCQCGRRGHFVGSIEKFEQLVPDPAKHLCDRCRPNHPEDPAPDDTPPPAPEPDHTPDEHTTPDEAA